MPVAYARAARAVFDTAIASDRLDELALPCFYLQRHAVELALKELLHSLHEVESDTGLLQAAKQKPITASPLDDSDLRRLNESHDLKELIMLLEKNLTRTQWGAVLPTWKALVKRIEGVEQGSAERSRYLVVKRKSRRRSKGKRKAAFKRSFPRERAIDLKGLLRRVEQFLQEAVAIAERPRTPEQETSLLQDLGDESHWLDQELYSLGLL